MSDTSSLFVNEKDEQPNCPFEPFLPDSSDSDNNAEDDGAAEGAGSEEDDDGPEDNKIYCFCRKVALGFMVGCDGKCKDWFHGDCVGIKEVDKDDLIKFFCPTCIINGDGETLWEVKVKVKKEINSDDENNIVVASMNKVLGQRLPTRKKAIATTVPKKRIGTSKLRAQPTHKRATLNSNGFAAAQRLPISSKLHHSLPTFGKFPPGPRPQPQPLPQPQSQVHNSTDGDSTDGDEGSDGGDGMDIDDGSEGPQAVLAAGNRIKKSAVKVQRRTYVDVEDAPTNVDIMVKECLEKMLFSAQKN